MMDDEDKTRAVGMYRAGFSRAGIAARLGCSQNEVRNLLRARGVKGGANILSGRLSAHQRPGGIEELS